MCKKKTTEEFVQEARIIHGDKFDYRDSIYEGANKPISFICPIHGIVTYAHARDHLRGPGCPVCAGHVCATKNQFNLVTKDQCSSAAKSSKSLTDFIKNHRVEYNKSKQEGWLEEYHWDKKVITEETCLEAAKQCNTRTEFHDRFNSEYDKALKNGWIENYVWLPKPTRWKDEELLEIADRFDTKSELKQFNKVVYGLLYDRKLIDKSVWLPASPKSVDLTQKIWLIYVYEFTDNSAYVGLTRCLVERDKAHRRDLTDVVYSYSINNDIPTPDYKILKSDLDGYEAQYYEDYFKKEYLSSGWNILNRAKTGPGTSSLGGGINKWNERTCYEEALKWETKSDFQYKGSGAAYRVARKNGWLKNYTWFKSYRGRDIVQYSQNGELINTFESSLEAAMSLGSKSYRDAINDCARGRYKTSHGFLWKYKKDVLDPNGNIKQKISI